MLNHQGLLLMNVCFSKLLTKKFSLFFEIQRTKTVKLRTLLHGQVDFCSVCKDTSRPRINIRNVFKFYLDIRNVTVTVQSIRYIHE